jgi:DNA-binding transcriptional LysR family regulator
MRIKELEKQPGVKLLIRLGRRDQLTEAGRYGGSDLRPVAGIAKSTPV